MNLAAYRFRRVLAQQGGPVERLTLCDLMVMGRRQFQANAFLRDDLIAWRAAGQVFSDAAGSGTADSPMVARFKAISEALERWAHMEVISSEGCRRFGFEIDPSSNGMAAYPGWCARQARQAALWEAAERFNVLHWWEGYLEAESRPAPWPGVDAVAIRSAVPGVTVILHRQSESGHHAYGHAAGPTFAVACERAAVELERHDYVIRQYRLTPAGVGARLPEAHLIEQRSLFFSEPEGYELFAEHLAHRTGCSRPDPELIFDGPIPGPWSRYADVWRVVFAPPSERFLGNDHRYFFW